MLKLKLNDFKYRYDVYHIFKIFYGLGDIDFVDDDFDYSINIFEDKLEIKSSANDFKVFNFDGKFRKRDEVKGAIFKYLKDKTGKEFPWGTLIGIRPTKILLNMMEEGKTKEEIVKLLKEKYFLREDKAELSLKIAKMEKNSVNKKQDNISVYIGMPFCPTRCLYCSFISSPINICYDIVEEYLKTLKYEIRRIREFIDKKNLNIECVYFGGGTPTSVNDDEFESILSDIYINFVKNRNIKEFNVECGRPDSITENKLKSMKKYDVTRISINPQTMNNDTLKAIGRDHTSQDVVDKFYMARQLGFDNINMDIIIGLPNEGLTHVKKTCSKILELKPDSLTVHGLSVKRASKLHENMVTGKIKIKEQKELNEMYGETVKLAKNLGMNPYYMYRQKNMMGNMENVGYCMPNKNGIYNIEMIEEKQTIIGLGAHSVTKVIFLDENRIERFPNIKDVREYIKRIEEKIEKKINLLEELY